MKSGFILINKPEGPTSFDIIRDLRRSLKTKKMGHAGTLDPLASGLLIVAVEQATKLLPLVPVDSKEYHFSIQFGETRTTGDREGDVAQSGFLIPTRESIEAVLPLFRGTISQVPPAYSAIKVNGQRAYDLARKGEEVILQSREIDIESLELVAYDEMLGKADLVVNCSTGTYVRSLAADIATALGSGAYASRIHRTRVGMFYLENAFNTEDVISEDQVLDPQTILAEWGTTSIEGRTEILFRNGNAFATDLPDRDRIWVTGENGSLIALAKVESGMVKSLRNFC